MGKLQVPVSTLEGEQPAQTKDLTIHLRTKN